MVPEPPKQPKSKNSRPSSGSALKEDNSKKTEEIPKNIIEELAENSETKAAKSYSHLKMPWLEWPIIPLNLGKHKLHNSEKYRPWLDWFMENQYSLTFASDWKTDPPSLTKEQWEIEYSKQFIPKQYVATQEIRPWIEWPIQQHYSKSKFQGNKWRPWLDWSTEQQHTASTQDRKQKSQVSFKVNKPWLEWQAEKETRRKLGNTDIWKPWLDWGFEVQFSINHGSKIEMEPGLSPEQWKVEYEKEFKPKTSTKVTDPNAPWLTWHRESFKPIGICGGDKAKPWLDWGFSEANKSSSKENNNGVEVKTKNISENTPWLEWPQPRSNEGKYHLQEGDKWRPWLDWPYETQYSVNIGPTKEVEKPGLTPEEWEIEYTKEFVPSIPREQDSLKPWLEWKEQEFKPKGGPQGDKWRPWLDWGEENVGVLTNSHKSHKTSKNYKNLPWVEWPTRNPHEGMVPTGNLDVWKPWLDWTIEQQYSINKNCEIIAEPSVLSAEQWLVIYSESFVQKESSGNTDKFRPWTEWEEPKFNVKARSQSDKWRPWLDWEYEENSYQTSKKEQTNSDIRFKGTNHPWIEWQSPNPQAGMIRIENQDQWKPWLDWTFEKQYSLKRHTEIVEEQPLLSAEQWSAIYAESFTRKEPSGNTDNCRPWTEWPTQNSAPKCKPFNNKWRPWLDWVTSESSETYPKDVTKAETDECKPWLQWPRQQHTIKNGICLDPSKPWLDWHQEIQYSLNIGPVKYEMPELTVAQWEAEYAKEFKVVDPIPLDSCRPWNEWPPAQPPILVKKSSNTARPWLDWQ
ncbi:hypothetical protein HK096_005252 [Nowakowskiella sp. JEL0078]|nr:hypothetical protein HK096_005252 [Nowakowskiella sp. JEL0078]